MTVNDPFFALY